MVRMTAHPDLPIGFSFTPANPAYILIETIFRLRDTHIWTVNYMVTLLIVQRKILRLSLIGHYL